MHDNEPDHQIITDLSEDEAARVAHIEGDGCEHDAEDGSAAQDAYQFPSLADDESDSLSADAGLSIGQFLQPGGGFAGSEAPVRRAIQMGAVQGLTVTSLKRSSGSSGSETITSARSGHSRPISPTARARRRRWMRLPTRSQRRSGTRTSGQAC
jgi:hypothetical protein